MDRILKLQVSAAFLALLIFPAPADAGVIGGGWGVFGNASFDDGLSIKTQNGLNANRLSAGLGMNVAGFDIRHGSAVMQTLTVGENGGELSFKWNFLTNEVPGQGNFRNDFAFWSLVDQQTGSSVLSSEDILARALDSDFVTSTGPFARETGGDISHELSAGNYVLSFGVANVGHNTNHSLLRIDQFSLNGVTQTPFQAPDINTIINPEPASLAIWGLGLVGVGAGSMRRRRGQLAAKTA